MTPAAPSPFLEIPEAEWVCANDLCFAIYDSFPVSPGHVLVITRRVVPTFFECTAAEQQALMALVGEVKTLLDERLAPKPDGYNVGFNAGVAAGQTVPHVHVHVIPRYAGDMSDPRGGVRHVIPEKGNYLAGPRATSADAPRLSLTTPVYDLTAAAGFWGPESVPEEIGWTEVPGVSLKPGMFVARVTGTSMEPLIPDGSWCLFRPCPAGSREGRIVLVQLGTDGASENGGRFTIKKYHSEKTVTADGWRHTSLQLLPLNPAFEPIEIEADVAADVVIVGEFSAVVPPG